MPFLEHAAKGRVAEGDDPEAQIIGDVDRRFVLGRDGRLALQAATGGGGRSQSGREKACPQELTHRALSP